MPSDYPGDLDALPLPDFDGALGQPARPASGLSSPTSWTRSSRSRRRWRPPTTLAPILIQSGVLLNVLDFGAIGNGVANDTTAIQAAVTAAVGKELFYWPGTYLVDSAITIPTAGAMTLTGIKGASVIKAHSSKSLTDELLTTTAAAAPARSVTHLTLRGLVFDGALLAPERWLQNPTTGAAITDPEDDYYDVTTNPSGKIRNSWFPRPTT